ncbi:Hypothetical protein PHPALM_18780 [Phytophthora palmivora]|uniref:Uncharacterized protein n=1 Tax=Phytophthora palmivora TaxID=4796 RepID=A0A2P4XIX7_9STRA|nr:Hypothetical protein PHPALM_18780 [Phytophthora palmivora]
MYDIKRQSSQLEATSGKLKQTKVVLGCVDCDDECTRCQSDSEIKKLEKRCTKLEDSVVFHKERERMFLDDLNSIGSLENDELRWLASVENHYA